MKIGSLCSGAGGLDMAVELVFAAETAWHCEIDAAATKVLAHRWPGVPNHRDLITTDWTAVEPIDILCAGWPCQPFSLAGKRKGADDDRAIWPHIATAIRILRPRIIVLENVSAVLAREFGRVADSLAALGYDLRWECLRASDVGAPHRRERLFVVADSARNGRNQGWPESTGIERGSHASVGGAADVNLLPTPQVADSTGGHMNRSGARRDELLLPGIAKEDRFGRYKVAIARWEALTRPAPSPTEPNARGNPRLNPAFSEWMMGWPAGWVTDLPGLSRNDKLRIIGNGVVPQQAMAALQLLVNLDERIGA